MHFISISNPLAARYYRYFAADVFSYNWSRGRIFWVNYCMFIHWYSAVFTRVQHVSISILLLLLLLMQPST